MSNDDMIAVIQDRKNFYQVQVSSNYGSTWADMMPAETFNFVSCIYRRKPEPPKPREWWLIEGSDGKLCDICGPFESKTAAEAKSRAWHFGHKLIHVREVL